MNEPTGQQPQSSPPWVWALLVALSLVVITAGAIVGMVTTDDEDGDAAGAGSAASDIGSQPATSAPLVPPTVSIPPITDPSIDTGAFGETDVFEPTFPPATETIPPATVPPATVPPATTGSSSSSTGTWPAGQSGYTVVLDSVPESDGRTAADAAAQRAIAAGLPSVGVLRSSDYSSLRPGFWVTYSGVFTTLTEARTNLPRAQSAGFSSAYTRRVSP